jgi:hypothetical protein
MGDIVRIIDYERRSREPDACAEQRDPTEATVIILPAKQHNTHRLYDGPDEGPLHYPPCDVSFDDGVVTIAVGESHDVFGGPEVQVFERH